MGSKWTRVTGPLLTGLLMNSNLANLSMCTVWKVLNADPSWASWQHLNSASFSAYHTFPQRNAFQVSEHLQYFLQIHYWDHFLFRKQQLSSLSIIFDGAELCYVSLHNSAESSHLFDALFIVLMCLVPSQSMGKSINYQSILQQNCKKLPHHVDISGSSGKLSKIRLVMRWYSALEF